VTECPLPLPPNGVAFSLGAAVMLVRTEQVAPLPPLEPLELGVAMKARMMPRIAHITPAAMKLAMAVNALVVIAPPILARAYPRWWVVSQRRLHAFDTDLGYPVSTRSNVPAMASI